MTTFHLQNFTGTGTFPFFIQYGYHHFSLDMHRHADFFELTVVLEGTALHTVNGESYFIKKGDVFGVNDSSEHCFTECRNFRICNIMFRPDVLFSPFPDLKHCPGFHSLFILDPLAKEQHFKSRLRLSIDEFDKVSQKLEQIIREFYAHQPGFVSLVTAYFIELIMYFIRHYNENQSVSNKITAFAKAVAFMEIHFTEKLLLKELADLAGLSVRQFQRQFKSTYLMTPQEYLITLRMQRASSLLAGSNETISCIAPKCGYSDANLFSRQFKKHTGLSPKQYREQCLSA